MIAQTCLKEISSTRSKHDDDSTWDPGDDEYKNSISSLFEDDNYVNAGNHDDHDNESIESAGSTDQVKTKPHFDHRDVAILKLTNNLLCPGDLVSYCQRHPQGKPKSSTIASLLYPSTPDKMESTLDDEITLRPFVHDVKQEKNYGGGACRQLTDPLSVRMKMK